MDIVQKLKEMGASNAQLESKTVQMVVQALSEDQSIIPDTAMMEINNLIKAVDRADGRLARAEEKMASTLSSAEYKTQLMQNAAEKAARDFERATEQKESVILDKDLQEAVKAYKAVLQATKEVFGERAGSPDVIIAAIQAGSYTAWRGIMGPKNDAPAKKDRYI